MERTELVVWDKFRRRGDADDDSGRCLTTLNTFGAALPAQDAADGAVRCAAPRARGSV